MENKSKEKQISYKLDLILSKLESIEENMEQLSDKDLAMNHILDVLDAYSNQSTIYINEIDRPSNISISHFPN